MRGTSPLKQLEYASKLKIIDSHLLRNELNQQPNNLQYEEVLKLMAMKLVLEPVHEITPFAPKTIIFDTFSSRQFIIKQQSAPKGKLYILNVNTYVPIRLEIKISERPSQYYNFQGNKAIQIQESHFSEVVVVATVAKVGIFSSVKFYLDLIQIQHKSIKKSSVNLRPNIDKQLQEYLVRNRGKSAEILRNRSLMRKESLSRRTATNFNPPVKSPQLVRSKSQYQHFQHKKSLYIKHVRKMSPSKVKVLEDSEQRYRRMKNQQMQKLAIIIYTAKLSKELHDMRVMKCRKMMRKMKVIMLCQDFIRIIKNKFKLKMTEKAKLRMSLHHTMQFLPLTMKNAAVVKAKAHLLEFLTPYMDFRMLQTVARYSQDYMDSTVKIQRYFRSKSTNLRERALILMELLSKKLRIDLPLQKQRKIGEKYVKSCLKSGGRTIVRLFKHQQRLISLLRENVQ